MKSEIKSRFTGDVIFGHTEEGNTIKKTVEAAVKSKVNLHGANLCEASLYRANLGEANLYAANLCEVNLRGASLYEADLCRVSLRGADLRGADLRGANLREADLRGAILRGADLRGAILRGADLCEADLCEATLGNTDLREANLDRCIGNMRELHTMQIDTYAIAFTKNNLQIGCKQFTHAEWRNFTDKEIDKMDKSALIWWKKWKDFIFMAIELSYRGLK